MIGVKWLPGSISESNPTLYFKAITGYRLLNIDYTFTHLDCQTPWEKYGIYLCIYGYLQNIVAIG